MDDLLPLGWLAFIDVGKGAAGKLAVAVAAALHAKPRRRFLKDWDALQAQATSPGTRRLTWPLATVSEKFQKTVRIKTSWCSSLPIRRTERTGETLCWARD
jgi:hypothetical protein